MPFLLAEILNFQGSTHHIGVGSFSYLQSTAQIASELGMTERSVEGKLYRLKKQLRKMLGGEVHE